MNRIRLVFLGGWIAIAWGGCAEPIFGQTAEEEFDAYVASIKTEFYQFEDSIVQDFAVYLEQAWQEFTVYEGTEPPVYAGGFAPESDGGKAVARSADGLFFGYPIQALSAFGSALSLKGSSEKAVADGWRALAADDNASFFKNYSEYSSRWKLNDWGRYLLLRQTGEKLHAGFSSGERVLFLFYTLSRSGYRVKIGRTGNDALVLLLSFDEEVYRLPYIRADGLKYYVVDAPGKLQKLYSIGRDYPKTHQTVSLKMRQGMSFPDDPVVREYTGKYGFTVSLNRNLIDFYASYPLCDLSVYFGSKPSATFEGEMDRIVKKQLADKTRLGQVVWLLDFVQQSVMHRPDETRHGKEVYYFPEETLFHAYADCEDLSVFLSWLLSRYVTREVVILYYPSHVAVAMEKPDGYEGNVICFKNKEYVICDPSYHGAVPGHVIPACASLKPSIVKYVK